MKDHWLRVGIIRFPPKYHVASNFMKCLRFVWTTLSYCQNQTWLPIAGNNLRKRHFIVCHVPKFLQHFGSRVQGFSTPARHFESREGPGDEIASYFVFSAQCAVTELIYALRMFVTSFVNYSLTFILFHILTFKTILLSQHENGEGN